MVRAQAIQEQGPVPVVFLTAFAEGEKADSLRLALPSCHILGKPYEEFELRTVLGLALQQ